MEGDLDVIRWCPRGASASATRRGGEHQHNNEESGRQAHKLCHRGCSSVVRDGSAYRYLPVDALPLLLILGFGLASYAWGSADIWRGRYRPSVFSRAVWLVLAVVSFASVVASGGTTASIVLAGILLAGNATICLLSLARGSRTFGRLEVVSSALIAASVAAWIATDSAFVGLVMSLVTHLIGALPTLARTWRDPRTESTGFWFCFFAASVVSLFVSAGDPFAALVLPLYFSVFDGTMVALSVARLRSR